jgi:hypothetical protein
MKEICAFFDDLEDDGWGRVTGINHQPQKLSPERLAEGVLISPGRPPKVREGWNAVLYVHPERGVHEWRVERDEQFRMPAGEFLALLPPATRVAVRASDDPILQDWLAIIDALIMDNAARGIHPGSSGAKAGLAYLVSQGLLTAEQMAEISEP